MTNGANTLNSLHNTATPVVGTAGLPRATPQASSSVGSYLTKLNSSEQTKNLSQQAKNEIARSFAAMDIAIERGQIDKNFETAAAKYNAENPGMPPKTAKSLAKEFTDAALDKILSIAENDLTTNIVTQENQISLCKKIIKTTADQLLKGIISVKDTNQKSKLGVEKELINSTSAKFNIKSNLPKIGNIGRCLGSGADDRLVFSTESFVA